MSALDVLDRPAALTPQLLQRRGVCPEDLRRPRPLQLIVIRALGLASRRADRENRMHNHGFLILVSVPLPYSGKP
jgi:hypothetical protein